MHHFPILIIPMLILAGCATKHDVSVQNTPVSPEPPSATAGSATQESTVHESTVDDANIDDEEDAEEDAEEEESDEENDQCSPITIDELTSLAAITTDEQDKQIKNSLFVFDTTLTPPEYILKEPWTENQLKKAITNAGNAFESLSLEQTLKNNDSEKAYFVTVLTSDFSCSKEGGTYLGIRGFHKGEKYVFFYPIASHSLIYDQCGTSFRTESHSKIDEISSIQLFEKEFIKITFTSNHVEEFISQPDEDGDFEPECPHDETRDTSITWLVSKEDHHIWLSYTQKENHEGCHESYQYNCNFDMNDFNWSYKCIDSLTPHPDEPDEKAIDIQGCIQTTENWSNAPKPKQLIINN